MLITMLNNAAGCYDRIRARLNTVTTICMGCPKEVTIHHARVLTPIHHYIRTWNGIFKDLINVSKDYLCCDTHNLIW